MRYLKYFPVLIFIAVFFLVGWPELRNSFSQIPLLFQEANKALLLLLLFLRLAAYFSDVWLSWVLINMKETAVKLKDIMRITILGVLGSQVAPIMGSAGITYIFYRKLKILSADILFMITARSFFVFLSYSLPFLLSLIFLPNLFFTFVPGIAVVFAAAIFLIIVFLLYFLLKFKATWRAKIDNFIGNFYQYLPTLLKHKTKIIQASLGALVYYFSSLATLYFSFLVFGFHPNPIMIIFGYTIALILSILTFIPEIPGVVESSLILVFLGLGFPAQITLFSCLLFRFFSFWLPLPIGVIVYLAIDGKNLLK